MTSYRGCQSEGPGIMGPVLQPERRSPWRLLLDSLGLRSKGKQRATHPERIGLK